MNGTLLIRKRVGHKVIAYKIPLYLMPQAGGFTEIIIKGVKEPFKIKHWGKTIRLTSISAKPNKKPKI